MRCLRLIVLLPWTFLPSIVSGSTPTLEERARAIHERVLSIDTHVDVLLPSTPSQYFGPDGKSRAELSKIRRGGVDVITLALAVGPGPRTPQGLLEARNEVTQKLAEIRRFVGSEPANVEIALSSRDIERIHTSGKVAVLTSFLNARSIGTDIAAIDYLYKSGVRLFGFTHAGNNYFADSSRPTAPETREHGGLSTLGRLAVAKLNDLGVIIDISQLTPEGVAQVLSLTRAPVIASHSAARALVDHPRNLSDVELDAIKANGGIVSVTPFHTYIAPLPPDLVDKVRALRLEFGLSTDFTPNLVGFTDGAQSLPPEGRGLFFNRFNSLRSRATVSNYVDHIDYIGKRIGFEHVGIGSDFNHGSGIEGFDDEGDALNITREFVRRGYTESQIASVWGGNFLRVFRAVERVAGNSSLGADGAPPATLAPTGY
ncbi:MAG: membrane dipeptidase [Gammaproteobacteria bacterium]|nr:membrane dipeptidase [Gammaproteobacteria bacterium]